MSRPAWLVADGNLAFTDSTAANAWATANPSLVYEGLLATIGGSAYIWKAGAWAAVGGVLQCFDTIAARDAAHPTPSLGQKAMIKRLCGNGYFEMSYEGSRWAVRPGESIIRDAGAGGNGYSLIATGTAYVVLASYSIPADIIGIGDEWEVDVQHRTNTYVSGTTTGQARLATILATSASGNAGANNKTRNLGTITRSGTNVKHQCTATLVVANQANNAFWGEYLTNMGVAQTIDFGIIPGSAGDVSNMFFHALRRIS